MSAATVAAIAKAAVAVLSNEKTRKAWKSVMRICASSAPALSVKSSRPTAASISRMRLITSEARNKAK